jgi:hypothetical protein
MMRTYERHDENGRVNDVERLVRLVDMKEGRDQLLVFRGRIRVNGESQRT